MTTEKLAATATPRARWTSRIDLPVATATPPDWAREATLRRQAIECLPAAHAWPDEIADLEAEWRRGLGTQWRRHARTINRLLAAHAFASWTAYRESGIRTLITELSRTLAVLRHEAARVCRRDDAPLTAERLVEVIRQTDLLLVHLVDRESLAAEAGR